MPEIDETTIDSNKSKKETKEKAKKESKRARRKREKEQKREMERNLEQNQPVTERITTREAYDKKKDYKKALKFQAAQLYQIDAFYAELEAQIKGKTPASNDNLTKAQQGDIISIQHTDENGKKTFSEPMRISNMQKDADGNVSYILEDMNGKLHTLANANVEVLFLKNEKQAGEILQEGKSKLEKADLKPKKLQEQITGYKDRIAKRKAEFSAWKEDYLKAPEKPKEEPKKEEIKEEPKKEEPKKEKINTEDGTIKWTINAVPTKVQDFMKENGMLEPEAKWMNSRQLDEYLKTTEFEAEKFEKLNNYLSDKPARQAEFAAYRNQTMGRSR